jgi:hypothetical protein
MSICSKIVKNKTLCNIRNIKHIKMKKLFKIITVLFIGLIIYSCSEEESQNDVSQNTKEELFAKKTFEIYEELSTNNIPKKDLKYCVYKDANGFLNAKYEVIGQTKKEIQMGSFVNSQVSARGGGTECDGKWSCGKAIYDCLENDQDALISEGACTGVTYCVTCQDPE